MPSEHDWAGPRPLRLATAVSFAPAFPLCIAHGVISRGVVPAIGLVPLALSAAAAVVVLSPSGRGSHLSHPAAVFATDTVLAAALMVTLVFTWVSVGGGDAQPSQSVLAAYATMPLLANLLLHFFFAIRAIYIGLALDSLVQWAAWRAVPPECPNCHHNLRPPLPSFPWLRSDNNGGGYASLFVNDEEARYHDDADDTGDETASVQPAPVDVKPHKGKVTSPAAAASPDAEASGAPWS